jgi:hypothetical protein
MTSERLREAESAVIGDCIMSPHSVRAVAGIVSPSDFEDVRLGQVFGLIAGMISAGGPESVTGLTVGEEISRRKADSADRDRRRHAVWPDPGEIAAMITNPHSGRTLAHAQLIREAAIGRETAAVCRRHLTAVESGEDPMTVLLRLVESAKAVRDSSQTTGLEVRLLADIFEDEDPGYDWLIPGLLERQDRLVYTGAEGAGKALALDTPIPTPGGWSTMGELTVGAEVFSADGTPVRIVGATDVMLDRPCYRVGFSDGSSLVADAEHLWLTETLPARETTAQQSRRGATKRQGTDQRHLLRHRASVVTTEAIRATLHARGGHALNHSVDTCLPVQYPDQELLIDPYALGAWLGDGESAGSRITCHPDDREILDRIASSGWPIRPSSTAYGWAIGDGRGRNTAPTETFKGRLRLLGVLDNKHIPEAYLTSSVEQRLALLQGLMDTDGTVSGDGRAGCEFSVCSEPLARGTQELLLSLGIKVTWRSGPAKLDGRTVGTRYRLGFQTDLPVFHLKRKADRLAPLRTRRAKLRYITSVESIPSVPVRCIQVERQDGMYLAGREFIPTHNSTFGRQMALCGAAGIHPFKRERFKPIRVTVIDNENSEKQWRRKARAISIAVKQITHIDPAMSVHLSTPGRLDITKPDGIGSIHSVLDEYPTDLLLIGPLYKLVPRAITNDDDAAPILAALDSLRERDDGPALMIEAHAGHAIGKGGERDFRPRGSAALLGWPEFGFGFAPDAEDADRINVVRWRGDRDERDWPLAMVRGGKLPWTSAAFEVGSDREPHRDAYPRHHADELGAA